MGSVSLLLFSDLTVYQVGARPHFHVYFTVSYGLSRAQLEEVNFLIKTSNPVSFSSLVSDKISRVTHVYWRVR